MKTKWLLTALLIPLAGCNGRSAEQQRQLVESREYRYTDGSHANDHRNLQWRLEQIEAKVDALRKNR